jgi:sugar phosphate isomerase/epimerase
MLAVGDAPGYDDLVQRRTFLTLAALAVRARAATRGMQLHLSCGALGIKADQRQAIELAAKHGFDAVDADGRFLLSLSNAENQDLIGSMRAKKISWGLAGLPVDFRGEEALYRDGVSKLPEIAKGLQRAEVRRMTTWIMPRSETLPYQANFKQHATRLREIARILNDHGLRFGLEYVGPKTLWAAQKYPFAHTMAETRELIAEIGQPNVGLVLDSWHWYHAGDTAADITALAVKDVVSVDLNDAPSGVPKDQMVDGKREIPAATGVIDVKSFLGALEKLRFDGPVRVEPFNEAVRKMAPDEAAVAAMAGLKKAFAS